MIARAFVAVVIVLAAERHAVAGASLVIGSGEPAELVVCAGFDVPVLRIANAYALDTFVSVACGIDSFGYAWGGARLTLLAFAPDDAVHDWPCGLAFSAGFGHAWGADAVAYNGHDWLFRMSVEFVVCGFTLGWAHWSNGAQRARNEAIDVVYAGWRFTVFD